MDMRFGTWNVRNLCRAGSLDTVASELAKYEVDLVAVQEVKWVEYGSQPVDGYTVFHGNRIADHHLGTGFFINKGIIRAVKRVEFISDRMSYITLRCHWFDIVLNMHIPIEDKGDDTKDGFSKELEHVFDEFPQYHMKILLGEFTAKIGREDIFKPTIGNESLSEISNDNGVRVVYFATSENLIVKCTLLPHDNIHKYTWYLLIGKHTTRLIMY
jgi:exonuclease III